MAQCVAFAEVAGAQVLVRVDELPCTTAVVLTPAEYAHVANNPFALSLEDGATVAGAVASVWLLAWVLRAMVRALGSDGDDRGEL
jgi:hypothetical protein